MKGVLLRVGIDQTFGEWNGPVDPDDLEFVYLPIPDDLNSFHSGLEVTYDSFNGDLRAFAKDRQSDIPIVLPSTLIGKGCHLDPDFSELTYGEQPHGRGKKISALEQGDFIAFFASLQPIRPCEHKLIYALIGIFFVDKIVCVKDVATEQWHINAHTRRRTSDPNDLVVFADPEKSGRFESCILIGSYRNRAYRVREDLLATWNGLDIKDGFIQRSVNPPSFLDPQAFLTWMESQSFGGLLSTNN